MCEHSHIYPVLRVALRSASQNQLGLILSHFLIRIGTARARVMHFVVSFHCVGVTAATRTRPAPAHR